MKTDANRRALLVPIYHAPPNHSNHHLNDTFNRVILEDLIEIDEEFERSDVIILVFYNLQFF